MNAKDSGEMMMQVQKITEMLGVKVTG